MLRAAVFSSCVAAIGCGGPEEVTRAYLITRLELARPDPVALSSRGVDVDGIDSTGAPGGPDRSADYGSPFDPDEHGVDNLIGFIQTRGGPIDAGFGDDVAAGAYVRVLEVRSDDPRDDDFARVRVLVARRVGCTVPGSPECVPTAPGAVLAEEVTLASATGVLRDGRLHVVLSALDAPASSFGGTTAHVTRAERVSIVADLLDAALSHATVGGAVSIDELIALAGSSVPTSSPEELRRMLEPAADLSSTTAGPCDALSAGFDLEGIAVTLGD